MLLRPPPPPPPQSPLAAFHCSRCPKPSPRALAAGQHDRSFVISVQGRRAPLGWRIGRGARRPQAQETPELPSRPAGRQDHARPAVRTRALLPFRRPLKVTLNLDPVVPWQPACRLLRLEAAWNSRGWQGGGARRPLAIRRRNSVPRSCRGRLSSASAPRCRFGAAGSRAPRPSPRASPRQAPGAAPRSAAAPCTSRRRPRPSSRPPFRPR